MKLQDLKKEYEATQRKEFAELQKAVDDLKKYLNELDYDSNITYPYDIENLSRIITIKHNELLKTLSVNIALHKIDQQ